MNQIDGHSAHYLLLQDPHELVSWVNQIDGYSSLSVTSAPRACSWVNQIDGHVLTICYFRTPTSLLVGEPD